MTTIAPVAQLPAGQRVKRIILPIVPFVLLLVVWASIKVAFDIPRGILPDVLAVFRIPFTLTDQYLANTLASIQRLFLGFIVAAVSGIVVGVAAGLSRRIAEFIGPLTTFMNAISGIAWIPLAIAWFGIGTPMVVFIIWNAAFFLVLGNTILGVRLVPRVLEEGLFTLGATRVDVIRQVIFPGALPHIVAGLRSGLGFGWRAVIAAELVGATVGLGQWIFIAQEFRRTDIIVAGAFTIGVIGLVMDRAILAPLERRTVERWGLVRSET